jgi:hypothetical protein
LHMLGEIPEPSLDAFEIVRIRWRDHVTSSSSNR